MIILEGPDGGGKSTMVKQIQEMYDFPVAERAVSSRGVGQTEIRRYVEEHLRLGYRDILLDRFALISGPIYGALTGMEPPNDVFKDLGWMAYAESLFLNVKPLVIYCLPPIDVVAQNIEADADSRSVVKSDDDVELIYYQYAARAARDISVGVGMTYDYTHSSPQQLKIVRGRIELKRRSLG